MWLLASCSLCVTALGTSSSTFDLVVVHRRRAPVGILLFGVAVLGTCGR